MARWKGIDGRHMMLPQLQKHIDGLPANTWASGMTLHNTAAPSIKQWTPENRAQRILNLEKYFRDDRKWSSAPHAFVDYDYVWLFTPFTTEGTHSPSWNGTKLGIEMVGDFSFEDDDAGLGLKIKKNTAALFAMLHKKYGWDPETIKLHKEDPRTDHDCPGKDIDKAEFIGIVQEYMGHAGDLDYDPPPLKVTGSVTNVRSDDVLNVREQSSPSSKILGTLKNGSPIVVTGSGMNGSTKWLSIETAGANARHLVGWVNAHYVTM